MTACHILEIPDLEVSVTLQDFFRQYPKVALAFSGGVDSAYLLYAAKTCGADVKPYYVKSDFQPQFELEDAQRLAVQLDIPLTVLTLDALADERVRANPQDRCYYCKQRIFTLIVNTARADGYTVLLDGTNASDDAADRPGMRALQELKVLSPLRLCGLTKADIRRLSQEAGLLTWNKPAYACLATRIPAEVPITREKLRATEQGEALLVAMGFRDFRIRMMGNGARIQVTAEQLPLVLEKRNDILQGLKPYYQAVLLDLEVRG